LKRWKESPSAVGGAGAVTEVVGMEVDSSGPLTLSAAQLASVTGLVQDTAAHGALRAAGVKILTPADTA
jgi:hypothetical protein